ncbi:ABC transporter permease subunit [Mollicutes bacterium LVI A0039]|nr:ABC transporter permease subunit [Mollicutes bacterium LVI A0039]
MILTVSEKILEVSANEYIVAALQTIYMSTVALVIALVFGIAIGVLLVITNKTGIIANKQLNQVINVTVNIIRSIPFIILLTLLLPLTRLIVGTTIGSTAVIIPLVFYSVPYMARLVEATLLELDQGIFELAKSYGASPTQTIFKFVLPEALPGIVLNITTLYIGLIGASAMAGYVGGGGIGAIAQIRGYNQFNTPVMIICVVILILIVQAVQHTGLIINKKIKH